MSIRWKFFIIIFAVIISFLISISIYFFIHKFINRIEKEKNIIIDLQIACIKNQVEINRLQNDYFMNQMVIYLESKNATENAFKELETINILPKINKSIDVALEIIFNLQDVIFKLNEKLVDDMDIIINDAKNVFQYIPYIKIEDFFQNEKALRYYDIEPVQKNAKALIDDIDILNNNLNSSLSIINSQFKIINSEIDNLKFRSNIISMIIVSFLIIICVVFSFFITNKIAFSIKQVEYAIEKIAKGDFTTKLNIKTKDEFKSLSENYNIFIQVLKNNINSELDFMKNISNSITSDSDIDLNKILELITISTLKDTNADGAAIFLLDDDKENFKINSMNGIFPPIFKINDINKYNNNSTIFHKSKIFGVNETILKTILETNQSIFIKNNKIEKGLKYNLNNNLLFINSFIAFPLILSGNIIGVIAIVTVKENNFLTDLDYTHLSAFTNYASLIIQNWKSYLELIEKKEIERDIKIASEIQKRLLPKEIVNKDKIDLTAYSMPAKGVGGDYYDIIKLDNNKIALVICDVAGKGISAALLMVMIRSILHLIISPKREIDVILSWINKGIIKSIDFEYFATFAMLVYDYNTREIIYSNAGHTPLLVYKKDSNKIFEIDTKGMPLGIENDSAYFKKRFKLCEGDFMIFYTDGIIEAMDNNGNQFKLDSLKKILLQNNSLSSKNIVDKVMIALKKHVGNMKQHDDQTLLLMKVD